MDDLFSNLPANVIVYMALTLDLPEILSLCRTSSRFNKTVCLNKDFWIQRLQNDFGIKYLDIVTIDKNPKRFYETLMTKPDEIYYQAMKHGSPDYIIGIAVRQLIKISGKYKFDRLLKGETYYATYEDTIAYKSQSIDFDLRLAINHIVSNIIIFLVDDIYAEAFDELGTDFREFYNVDSIEDYEIKIRQQLNEIQNRDTVVVRVKVVGEKGKIYYDNYILHKFVL